MANLRIRWSELLVKTEITDPELTTYKKLVALYSEQHRVYHNLTHIAHCLDEYRQARQSAEHQNEVEMALWFHDAIYNTRSHDNEEKSAELSRQELKIMGAEDSFGDRVHDLILVTKHIETPVGIDAEILADVDLSILGKSPIEFNYYEDGIRQEYFWVPDEQFRSGRVGVLKRFLDRPSIYLTDFFRQKYEEQARKNLEISVARLRRQI